MAQTLELEVDHETVTIPMGTVAALMILKKHSRVRKILVPLVPVSMKSGASGETALSNATVVLAPVRESVPVVTAQANLTRSNHVTPNVAPTYPSRYQKTVSIARHELIIEQKSQQPAATNETMTAHSLWPMGVNAFAIGTVAEMKVTVVPIMQKYA